MPTAEQMRRRLWDELDELKSLDDSIEATREQEAQAMAAADTARRRLSELQLRRLAVIKDKNSIMRALNTLATFPFELLSLIFTYTNTTCNFGPRDSEGFSPARRVDRLRRALPFRLSLVCRRWREVLAGTPAVWGYVGIAFDGGGTVGSSRAVCVHETLSRSGSSPLDVAICYQFSTCPGAEDGAGQFKVLTQEEHFRRILHFLQANMTRIRSLHVSAAASNVPLEQALPEITRVREKVLHLLRTPSPSLVDLRVEFPSVFAPGADPGPEAIAAYWHGGPGDTTPLFLPVAPNLQIMHLAHVPVVCRRTHPGLPSLEYARISEGPIYEAHVADFLAAASNVQCLILDVGEAQDTPHIPLVRTTLRRLKKVEFADYSSFGLLSNGAELLPNLSDLHICLLDDLSVSDTLARNLTRLRVLYQEGLDDYVDTLRQLVNVTRADFWQGSMRDDVFFAPFFDAEAPMWPRLATLKLNGVVTESTDRDSVLRLVRARNCNCGQSSPSVRPLKNVDYDNVSVPSWIDVQIRAILPEVWELDDP